MTKSSDSNRPLGPDSSLPNELRLAALHERAHALALVGCAEEEGEELGFLLKATGRLAESVVDRLLGVAHAERGLCGDLRGQLARLRQQLLGHVDGVDQPDPQGLL